MTIIDPNTAPSNIFWEVAYGLLNQPGYCPDSLYRHYAATDACNNKDTCLQKIYIEEDTVCELCQDNVQYWPVDLTEDPPMELNFDELNRTGLCCDYTIPRRCVAFNMMLHPDAIALSVDIRQGNSPWQSASINAGDWRINCEPVVFTNNVICLGGEQFFTLTHCKPGSNTVDYRFITIPGAIAQGPPITRVDCPKNFTVTNIENPVWTSIFPGPTGMYDRYLSCTNCFLTTFTPTPPPPIPDPPVITYQVCGDLLNNICEEGTDCDEVTIEIFPAISLGCDGQTFNFCGDGVSEDWKVPIDVLPPSDYLINITNPAGITSSFTNQNNFYYTPPSNVSGAYTVFIQDLIHDYGCDSAFFAFNIEFHDCIICPEPGPVCYDESITLTSLADFLALGGVLDYPCEVNPSTFEVTSQSDNQSCPETISYFVELTDTCGNYASCGFDLIKQDTLPPTWVTAAGALDRTADCDDAAALAAAQALFPVATDNCDDDVSDIIKTAGTFNADTNCPYGGTYTNSWTVTDYCGNVSPEFHPGYYSSASTPGTICRGQPDIGLVRCCSHFFPVLSYLYQQQHRRVPYRRPGARNTDQRF